MNRKVAAAVVLIIALSAVGIGYAAVFHTDYRGAETDTTSIPIIGIDASDIVYDTSVDMVGGVVGGPVSYTTPVKDSKLTYVLDTSKAPASYYFKLNSYRLHLDDGTVVEGTANSRYVDITHSTVATGSSLTLTLDNLVAERVLGKDYISFTVSGTTEADTGKPVSTGSPSSGDYVFISSVDVVLDVIDESQPSVGITVFSSPADGVVAVGGTVQMGAFVELGGNTAYGYTVTWSSSSPAVSVYSNGLATAVAGADTVTITGSFAGHSDTADLHIVSVTATDYLGINAGGTADITASCTYGTISYTIAPRPETVIHVDQNGHVTADSGAAAGTTSIVAITASQGGVHCTKYCQVTVLPTLSLQDVAQHLGDAPSTPSGWIITPSGNVKWTSSDESVATVSGGVLTITQTQPGSATITATLTVGRTVYSDSCTVTVTQSSDTALIYVKWVSQSNGLPPQGTITIAGSTRVAGDVFFVMADDLSTQTLSSSSVHDMFAIVEHEDPEPTNYFTDLTSQRTLSSIGISQGGQYDLYLEGETVQVHTGFAAGHAPSGTIKVGDVTVTSSTSIVYVYASLGESTKITSTNSTDKYSTNDGDTWVSFSQGDVIVGNDHCHYKFQDSTA